MRQKTITLDQAAAEYHAARERYRVTRDALRVVAVAAVRAGESPAYVARDAGISRTTLHLWTLEAPESVSPAGL